jgi:prepilin-type N-terminal cleavage/methylation domain-containing protein
MARKHSRSPAQARTAFTLVEMLTVIVIISLLAALIVPAVMSAIKTARQGAMKMEVTNLAMALENYRNQMGEYPPDFSQPTWQLKQAAINAHLSRAYRQRNLSRDYNGRIPGGSNSAGQNLGDLLTQADLDALNPTNALWFWLRGFSPDPQRPVTGSGNRTASYEFKDTQLWRDPTSPFAVRYAPSQDSQRAPYLYYRANTAAPGLEYALADLWSYDSGSSDQKSLALPSGTQVTMPRPYFSNKGGVITYAEPQKFQIICAGLDGTYGQGGRTQQSNRPVTLDSSAPANPLGAITGIFPDGPYSSVDFDNITNFTVEPTLEDSQP